MLSVQIHKDVLEYKPKVVAGLTGRTLAALAAGCGFALLFGVFCTFVLHIDSGTVMYVVWIAAAPAALVGFYQPHGLPFEKFLPLWWEHTNREQTVLYRSPAFRAQLAAGRAARAEAVKAGLEARANPYWKKLREKEKTACEIASPGGALATGSARRKTDIERFWDGE